MNFLMLLLVLTAVPAMAQQSALTSDGKPVLLNDDGTWEYTEEGAALASQERKEFWTATAINAAKVLGILATLVVLRFVIQAVGEGVAASEDVADQNAGKTPGD